LVPQLAAPWTAQRPAGSPVPAGTGVHIPRLPTTAQDMQVPLQAVAQHTPSVQIPLAHSSLPPHAVPITFRPHETPLQTAGLAQSALEVQVERQAATTSQR
jgi:hypothetical protein